MQVWFQPPRRAQALWCDHVQRLALLLVRVEVPQPPPDVVAQLEATSRELWLLMNRVAIVNPALCTQLIASNLETLQPARSGLLASKVYYKAFWRKKVAAIELSEDQREKVRFLTQRHSVALAALDAELQAVRAELAALMPATLGMEVQNIASCDRTEALMRSIKR